MSQDALQQIAALDKKLNESAIAGSSPVPFPPSSYVRYGTEWESELMKFPKKHLIGMLRNELIASMRQPPSAVSDTPETDKIATGNELVHSGHARILERERDAARKILDDLDDNLLCFLNLRKHHRLTKMETLEKLKKIGHSEGKDAFDADIKAGEARAFFCPGFPLVLRKMKSAGYDISDCEETIQAAFEFATAFRDEYSKLYFRHFAP